MIITKKFVIALSISLVVLLIGIILNYYTDKYIQENFQNRPKADDYFFRKMKFKDLSELNEGMVIISFVVSIVFIVKNKFYNEIPFYLLIVGIFSILRAVFIVATPLANPFPNPQDFGIMPSLLAKNGLFPSGHTSYPFIFFLFSYYKKKWGYYIMFLILFLLVSITMIICRGHYTIDIIMTIFISYSIYSFANKHLKWFVC